MKELRMSMIIVGSAFMLSGCLLTHPYHNQVIETTASEFNVFAWSNYSGELQASCKTGKTGNDSRRWNTVLFPRVRTEGQGAVDDNGLRIYLAQQSMSLPAYCWSYSFADDKYYTSFRVGRVDPVSGAFNRFYTVASDGWNCVYQSVTDSGSWLSWLNDGCYRVNSSTDQIDSFVVLIAERPR